MSILEFRDGFKWRLLPIKEARRLFDEGVEIYFIYPDDTESLIQDSSELNNIPPDTNVGIEYEEIIMSKKDKEQLSKIAMAVAVYTRRYKNVTYEELGRLGFNQKPSKEYLQERVLEILAEAYVDYYNSKHSGEMK